MVAWHTLARTEGGFSALRVRICWQAENLLQSLSGTVPTSDRHAACSRPTRMMRTIADRARRIWAGAIAAALFSSFGCGSATDGRAATGGSGGSAGAGGGVTRDASSDVVAVDGGSPEAGVDAAPAVTWTRESIPPPVGEDFGDVWGTSQSDVWVASRRRVLHWDGSSWRDWELGALFTGSRQHLAGSAPDDVWVSGQRVAHFDGSDWTELGAPFVGPDIATNVWRSSDLVSWAADLRGFWRLEGATWSPVTGALAPDPSRNITWHALWGAAPDDIWAAGIGGHRARYDGTSWKMVSDSGPDIMGMWGVAADAIWSVGSHQLWRFDGQDWSTVKSDLPPQRLDVWASSESDIWIVGEDGLVHHYDGSSWVERNIGSGDRLNAVWGTGDGVVWTVGEAGTIERFVRDD